MRAHPASIHSAHPSWLTPVLALLGTIIFAKSFFLAKRSMPHVSSCDGAVKLLKETLELSYDHIRVLKDQDMILEGNSYGGCWMHRRVDAAALIVVDALRFDFALYNLPQSIGARLGNKNQDGQSKLLKFVADPPTVTMQRLKGLTTGGLPTFADISGSFGGAIVDEDSWLTQLKQRRSNAKLAFVGDDTWLDLFPSQFDEAHPYPSFNTRDLDTVDNGCMKHLPHILQHFGPLSNSKEVSMQKQAFHRHDTNTMLDTGTQESQEIFSHSKSVSFDDHAELYFELMVVHFLGVDHVGHTYGPHNHHMSDKLHQMDEALTEILSVIDNSPLEQCLVAFVFGDHGMTEDGNHGGGTHDETHAALFAHYSPGCGKLFTSDAPEEESSLFDEIRQVDFVPTLSLLMGIPIPYANIGGLVPQLIPVPITTDASLYAATALALNAAQVWNYLRNYDSTANKLPAKDMAYLMSLFEESKHEFKLSLDAKTQSSLFGKSSASFKLFLSEATELGRRVWTRFDIPGMIVGIIFCLVALLLESLNCLPSVISALPVKPGTLQRSTQLQLGFSFIFILLSCAVLPFGDTYITAERQICMVCLTVLASLVAAQHEILVRGWWFHRKPFKYASTNDSKPSWENQAGRNSVTYLIALPILSRIHEVFVNGHGMDPSLHSHYAHSPAVFAVSLLALAFLRHLVVKRTSSFDSLCDLGALFCLFVSWCAKRFRCEALGFLVCRASIILICFGFASCRRAANAFVTFYIKCILILMVVTGPSASSSALLFSLQTIAISKLANPIHSSIEIHPFVLASIWRLLCRHMFFATGHACSFNKLQFSAAFVATNQFEFFSAGFFLFINTFGWEILGYLVTYVLLRPQHHQLWRYAILFQLLELCCACVAASILRRHLMVWAIFAPRFVFSAILSTILISLVVGFKIFQIT